MAVTDLQLQGLIEQELGLGPTDPVAVALPVLWAFYAEKAYLAPRLQYLYTKMHAIDLLLGNTWAKFDYSLGGDLTLHLTDQQKNLEAMRTLVAAEILKFETIAMARRSGVAGQITQVEPQLPPAQLPRAPGQIDSMDPRYRGDPYSPLRRV